MLCVLLAAAGFSILRIFGGHLVHAQFYVERVMLDMLVREGLGHVF